MAFEVTFELGDSPVEEALPTIREATIQLNLERPVLPNGLREPVRISIRRIDFQVSGRIDSGLRKANAATVAVVIIVSGQTQEQRATGRYCTPGLVDKR